MNFPDAMDALVRAYTEPHRRYHTLRHIFEMLELAAQDPRAHKSDGALSHALVQAIWWHDAVYAPGIPSERASVVKMREPRGTSFGCSGATFHTNNHAVDLIMLTASPLSPPADLDDLGACLLDLDLAILGADPVRYREYAQQVREEFHTLSDDAWREGRSRFLRDVLAVPRIYHGTTGFWNKREGQARSNIADELRRLFGVSANKADDAGGAVLGDAITNIDDAGGDDERIYTADEIKQIRQMALALQASHLLALVGSHEALRERLLAGWREQDTSERDDAPPTPPTLAEKRAMAWIDTKIDMDAALTSPSRDGTVFETSSPFVDRITHELREPVSREQWIDGAVALARQLDVGLQRALAPAERVLLSPLLYAVLSPRAPSPFPPFYPDPTVPQWQIQFVQLSQDDEGRTHPKVVGIVRLTPMPEVAS